MLNMIFKIIEILLIFLCIYIIFKVAKAGIKIVATLVIIFLVLALIGII